MHAIRVERITKNFKWEMEQSIEQRVRHEEAIEMLLCVFLIARRINQ